MSTKDSIKEHYEKQSSIDSWSRKGRVEDTLDMYGETSQNRALFGGISLHGTVLDLATGTGHYARKASEYGAEKVVCADISFNMLAKARELSLGIENIHFIQADGTRLPFKTGAFDFVVNVGLFEHLEETQGVIDQMHGVLKDGGLLVTRFTNGFSAAGMAVKMRYWLKGKVPFGYPYYRMYSVREAVRMHRDKFKIQQIRHCLLIPLPIIPGFALRFLHKISGRLWGRVLFGLADRTESWLCKSRLAGLFSYCFVIVFRKI